MNRLTFLAALVALLLVVGGCVQSSQASREISNRIPDALIEQLLAQEVEVDWMSLSLPERVQGKSLLNTKSIPEGVTVEGAVLVLGTPQMPDHGEYTFSSLKERADQLTHRELLLAFGYVKDEIEIPPPWRWMLDAYADYYFKYRSSPTKWSQIAPQLKLTPDTVERILALPADQRIRALGPYVSAVSEHLFNPFAIEFSPGNGWLQVITDPQLIKAYLEEIDKVSSVLWSQADTALVYVRVYGESGVLLEGVYPIGRIQSKKDVPVRDSVPIATGG